MRVFPADCVRRMTTTLGPSRRFASFAYALTFAVAAAWWYVLSRNALAHFEIPSTTGFSPLRSSLFAREKGEVCASRKQEDGRGGLLSFSVSLARSIYNTERLHRASPIDLRSYSHLSRLNW